MFLDSPEKILPQALDILRGSLMPHEAVEQIAHLLYLKWIDEEDIERRASGITCIFEGAAKRFLWSEWSMLQPSQMLEVLINGVFPFLGSQVKIDSEAGEYFRSVKMQIRSPIDLHSIVCLIGHLDLLRMSSQKRGRLIESLLQRLPSSPKDGQTLTPQSVRGLILELAQPHQDDFILDPCCGTGMLLAQASTAVISSKVNLARMPLTEQPSRIRGVEMVWAMARLARLNLIFHGHSGASVSCGNSLASTSPLSVNELYHGYSLVIANPPFGGRESPENVRTDLPTNARQSELLFLALAMKAISPGGRSVIVVPDGLLFGSTSAHLELKKLLVEEFDLHAVVSLGNRVSVPQSGVRGSILVFSRPKFNGISHDKRVWFYDFNTNTTRRPNITDQLPGMEVFSALWSAYSNSGFKKPPGVSNETVLEHEAPEPSGWWASVSTVRENDYILNPLLYKPRRQPKLLSPAKLQNDLLDQLEALSNSVQDLISVGPYISTDLSRYPQVRLADVTLEVPSLDPHYEPEEWVSYVDVSDLDRVSNSTGTPKRSQRKDLPGRARWRIKTGDVLISTVRPASSGIAIVKPDANDAIASGIFAVLRPATDLLLPEFLLQTVLEHSFMEALSKAARGSVMPTVSLSTIRGLNVRLPPFSSQHELVNAINLSNKIARASLDVTSTAHILQDTLRTLAFASGSPS